MRSRDLMREINRQAESKNKTTEETVQATPAVPVSDTDNKTSRKTEVAENAEPAVGNTVEVETTEEVVHTVEPQEDVVEQEQNADVSVVPKAKPANQDQPESAVDIETMDAGEAVDEPKVKQPEAVVSDVQPVQTKTKDIEPKMKIRGEERTFKSLSVIDRIAFRNLFIQKPNGQVEYKDDHETFAVKGISTDLLAQVQDDLRKTFKQAYVQIGRQWHMIDSSNAVFNTNTSTVRYLLYAQMASDQTALKVARQLLLEKHPDAEEPDFDFDTVRSDVLDIYAVLLASKASPEKDLVEKVEELTLKLNQMNESQEFAHKKLISYASANEKQLTGISLGQAVLLLEQFGLLKSAIPKKLNDMVGLFGEDNVVSLNDFTSGALSDQNKARKDTLERQRRQKEAELKKRRPMSQQPSNSPSR